jgi:SAM-dependent methyltransferase
VKEMTEHLKRFYSENERTLEEDIPELVDYIRPGYRVLDVGCGSGTVTLDVANAVNPGITIGIDPVEYAIECAQKFATKRKIKNATFQTGDGYHLPFEDASFNVVFSNTVLHYFNDPLRALKQQLRLVKPGGWLVAAGVREWGMVRRYPRCPSWDAVFDARVLFMDAHSDYERRGNSAMIGFGHTQTGSRCPGWFSKLGLIDRRVEVKTWYIQHSDLEIMKPFLMDLLPWETEDEHGYFGADRELYDDMISEGYLDRETLDKALVEAKAWFKDPDAFNFYITVFIAGKVSVKK